MLKNHQSQDLMKKLIEVDDKLEAINGLLAGQAPPKKPMAGWDLPDAEIPRDPIPDPSEPAIAFSKSSFLSSPLPLTGGEGQGEGGRKKLLTMSIIRGNLPPLGPNRKIFCRAAPPSRHRKSKIFFKGSKKSIVMKKSWRGWTGWRGKIAKLPFSVLWP